jgi:hypothetical protein
MLIKIGRIKFKTHDWILHTTQEQQLEKDKEAKMFN